MEPITDEIQEVFSRKKLNDNIMRVVDTILAASSKSVIDENWCLLNNQSTFNTFIDGKYLSNIIDVPDGKYLRVHCNAVVTYTKNIGDLPGYSNHVWYNPKGVANILSLRLFHKHHIVPYNSQYGNTFLFVSHSEQCPRLPRLISSTTARGTFSIKKITRTSR